MQAAPAHEKTHSGELNPIIATASRSLTPNAINDWATLTASPSYWLQVHSLHTPSRFTRSATLLGTAAAVLRSASPTVTGARAAAPSPIRMSTSHCGSVVVKVPLEMTSPVIISSMLRVLLSAVVVLAGTCLDSARRLTAAIGTCAVDTVSLAAENPERALGRGTREFCR